MYASYTAASFAREYDLADRHGVNFKGALTWAFTFEDQPYFAGFRELASCGLPLPVLNVFRMFSKMDGQREVARSDMEVSLDEIMRHGVRGQPDVGALASLGTNKLCVMVWHYHDDDVAGPDAAVNLSITGLPEKALEARLTHYRVDEQHSNAFAEWLRLGAPIAPDERQYRKLEAASNLAKLADAPATVNVDQGQASLQFMLPRQGVSLLILEW
jgi:xylan 1,4-beta-xylosidase